jgi:hypothetical protein
MMTAFLPIELWFEIFSYLDYFTIRALHRTKYFHNLLSSTSFDRALFRCPPPEALRDQVQPQFTFRNPSILQKGGMMLHPFLAQLGSFIDYNLPRDLNQLMIQPRTINGSSKPWRFIETNLPLDSAVMPPVHSIAISFMNGYAPRYTPAIDTPNITVGKVMKGMLSMVNGSGKWAWENIGSQGLEARFIGWEVSCDHESIPTLVAKYGV